MWALDGRGFGSQRALLPGQENGASGGIIHTLTESVRSAGELRGGAKKDYYLSNLPLGVLNGRKND